MKLADKGRYAPQPQLKGKRAQRVSETVASWPGVHARTHWRLGDETIVDGADFYLGDEEFGHLHLVAEAHVFHERAVLSALLAEGASEPFAWDRRVGVFAIRSAADVEHALWLFELSYDRLKGVPTKALLARVRGQSHQAGA